MAMDSPEFAVAPVGSESGDDRRHELERKSDELAMNDAENCMTERAEPSVDPDDGALKHREVG